MFGSRFVKSASLRFSILLMSICVSSAAHSEEGANLELPFVFKLFTFEEHPYVFGSKSNEPGLVVRYLQALLKNTPHKYSLEVLPAKRALMEVGNYDNACVFPIERSQEREVRFRWVSPMLISSYGMFALENKPYDIQVLQDVAGLRVGSYLGSGIGEYLADSGYNVDFAAKESANLTKLRAGRIDLWASDVRTAPYIAKANQIDLPKASMLFFTSLRAMACNKGVPQELVDELNVILHNMYKSGEIEDINRSFTKEKG